jgi:hypothetical protein
MKSAVALPIANRPNRRTAVVFQSGLVSRMRSMLNFRIAESAPDANQSLESARSEFEHWNEVVVQLTGAHQFPFIEMCESLELGQSMQDALVLIASPHMDATMRSTIHAYCGRRYIDAATVMSVVTLNQLESIAARRRFVDGGPLHASGLIESSPVNLGYASSALEVELTPTARLLRAFDGETGMDPRFARIANIVDADVSANVGVCSDAVTAGLARQISIAEQAPSQLRGAVVLLAGPHGTGKLRMAQALAARTGLSRLLVVEATLLPNERTHLDRTIAALAYEAEILGARLVLRGIEHCAGTAREAATLLSIVRNLPHLVWATSDTDPRAEQGSPLAILDAIS